jgi:hypothetical protein
MLTDLAELINVHSGTPLLAEVWGSMLLTTKMTIQFLLVVEQSGRDREMYFYRIQCSMLLQVNIS